VAGAAVTIAVNSNAAAQKTTVDSLKPASGSSTQPANWRLQYQVTEKEQKMGKVVYDLTYPPNDDRRYSKPLTLD